MNISRVITFHYNPNKFKYINRIVMEHEKLNCTSKIDIITNTVNKDQLNQLLLSFPEEVRKRYELQIISVTPPHRWLLPWYSKLVFKQRRSQNIFTHFMYSEDDLLFTEANRVYYLENIEHLKSYGLYPSFVRIERSVTKDTWVYSDLWLDFYKRPTKEDALPIPPGPSGFSYLNLSNPYQALFFYDKALFDEHESCESFDINRYGNLSMLNDDWGGGVAERAAFGLTFYRLPGFATSRNALAFDPSTFQLDSRSFIHHLPNNYADRHDVISLQSLFQTID